MCAHIACTRVAHTRRAPMPTNMTCSTAGSMHRLPRSPFRDASAGPGCGSPSTAPATTEASVVNIIAATCNATRSAFCPTCPTVAAYTYLGTRTTAVYPVPVVASTLSRADMPQRISRVTPPLGPHRWMAAAEVFKPGTTQPTCPIHPPDSRVS